MISAYQAQVRDIAPDELLDREEELDELVRFCADDQPYAWWQAGPWAGKSALMSWFVLHPPAGLDVVSFFVTARLAGQSDSDACTDALIKQLAALLGESPAELVTVGARRGTMLKLLGDAANRSREAGRRLLLVIDGLDEDSGIGSSIAALLPRRPPPDVRILVASRPHPPIPDDVMGDHPLRTIVPRQLAVSDHARDVERRAKHELAQLLSGSHLQRNVLGLITAAGGGLTLEDLERLTQRPPYEIEHLLGGQFGRSVGSRTGNPSAGDPDARVYLFTHETLRLVAEQKFGVRLAAYRDRVHTWANTYRQRGWPDDTPQYLLRSYPGMLASSGDLPRLIACVTDQLRHDRMRHFTSGDVLSFREISTAQQLILAQSDPDLTSLALIAVEREALANSNPDPIRRALALALLSASMATDGDHDRAVRLADQVLTLNRQITNSFWQGKVLALLVQAAIAGSDHDRAEELTDQITEPHQRAKALAQLVEAATAGDDHDRAFRLAHKAGVLAGQITPDDRARALGRLAEAVAATGDRGLAEVFTITNDPDWRAWALARLAQAVADGGDHEWGVRLVSETAVSARQITDPYWAADALARLAQAAAVGGDHDQAEELTGQITDPYDRARALVWLAEAIADGGDHDRAARLIGEAEVLAGWVPEQWRANALAQLAHAAAAGGDHDRAEMLASRITDPDHRVWVLARLAEAAAARSDHDRAARLLGEAEALTQEIAKPDKRRWALARLAQAAAASRDDDRAARLAGETEALTRQITTIYRWEEALARLAQAVAVGGDHDRAARLAGEAQALSRQMKHRGQLMEALARVGEAMAAGGDHDRGELFARQNTDAYPSTLLVAAVAASGGPNRAEVLAGRITDSNRRARVLARLAQVVAAGGDHDRAARLADEAETLVGQITLDQRAWALTQIVEVMADGGNHDRAGRLASHAEALTEWITSLYWRAEALARIAQAVTAGGDHDWAEALTELITKPKLRAEALARIAQAVAVGGEDDRAARLADEAATLARQITDPDEQAEALAGLARMLVDVSNETSPLPEHTRSPPLMDRARRLLAAALVTGSWAAVVVGLARVDPLAVTALADEVQERWGMNAPTATETQTADDHHNPSESRRGPQWVRGFLGRVREWG